MNAVTHNKLHIKVMKIFLLLLLAILLASCSKSSGKIDADRVFGDGSSSVSAPSASTVTSETSAQVEVSDHAEPERDLNGIGFRNRMGMNEWLSIDSYSETNMFVVVKSVPETYTLKDNYFYITSLGNEGKLKTGAGETYPISILDNDTFSIPSQYENYRIIERITSKKNKNFCIIKSIKTDTFSEKTHEYWFVPVDLIDWRLSPEKDAENGLTKWVYYFKQD